MVGCQRLGCEGGDLSLVNVNGRGEYPEICNDQNLTDYYLKYLLL